MLDSAELLGVLDQGFWKLSTESWPDWFLYMQAGSTGNACGWQGDPGPPGHFQFHRRADGYYDISTAQWPNCYLYMKNDSKGNIRGWDREKPGEQGEWLVRANDHGQILMTTKAWPDHCAYMCNASSANVRGWLGDPGVQGWWILHPMRPVVVSVTFSLNPLVTAAGGAEGKVSRTYTIQHGVDKTTYSPQH